MKRGFYFRIAWTGIKNNKKIYLPYILASVGMILMFYIIVFLSSSPTVREMQGGNTMQGVLGFGVFIMAGFALIFLFYTNSFLMRRRKREFGMYHVLGMGKKNLAKVMVWEGVQVTVISLLGGLLGGILFSKAAELVMISMLEGKAGYAFTISTEALLWTLKVFGSIFLLILIKSLLQIFFSKPIELLRSEAVGEKPPKANWLEGILGVVILAAAYYLAVSIEEPMAAIFWFFVAVAMVIVSTYILFRTGSVLLCKVLKKNKNYYYKSGHFVSISSMMYRMKRNGYGLASICILSTMVLVMVSAVSCMFIGSEDQLRTRYPRNIVIDTYSENQEVIDMVHRLAAETLEEQKKQAENVLHYRFTVAAGYEEGKTISLDPGKIEKFAMSTGENIRQLFVVPLEDYNRIMGADETLQEDEVLVYQTKSSYKYDEIAFDDGTKWKVKKKLSEFVDNGVDSMQIMPSVFIFVKDMDTVSQVCSKWKELQGESLVKMHDYYGFDLQGSDEEKIAVANSLRGKRDGLLQQGYERIDIEDSASERADFYAMYSGMFVLGILLGCVFILGMVLIMYYKQVTEGYEDRKRFEIMQKVGMTKREIRKSINSQVLTVFFLPLLAAGVHTAFAFPMMRKILLLLGVTNTGLLIGVMAGCYLLFSLFYILMYVITSKSYYGIVSSRD